MFGVDFLPQGILHFLNALELLLLRLPLLERLSRGLLVDAINNLSLRCSRFGFAEGSILQASHAGLLLEDEG